jgi:hypothetical protein
LPELVVVSTIASPPACRRSVRAGVPDGCRGVPGHVQFREICEGMQDFVVRFGGREVGLLPQPRAPVDLMTVASLDDVAKS